MSAIKTINRYHLAHYKTHGTQNNKNGTIKITPFVITKIA